MRLFKSPKFRKSLGYAAAVLLAYLIQYTPLMIPVGGSYFSPLFILTLCFASHENDLRSMIFGMICGMLTDLNSLTVPGYHAVIYLLFALIVSLMHEFYFQRRLRTAVFLSIVPIFLNSVCEWIAGTALCEGAWSLYRGFYFGGAVYTLLMLIPIYALFTVVFGFKNKYRRPQGVVPEKLEAVRRKYAARNRRRRRSVKARDINVF